jgi:hypothetical protein
LQYTGLISTFEKKVQRWDAASPGETTMTCGSFCQKQESFATNARLIMRIIDLPICRLVHPTRRFGFSHKAKPNDAAWLPNPR